MYEIPKAGYYLLVNSTNNTEKIMGTNGKPEIKQINDDSIPAAVDAKPESAQPFNPAATQSVQEKFKAAIAELDAERTALVKNTIENLKPGKPFDHAIIREINKIETRKNRLLVSRFAAMLKRNEPGIMPIVHQIIEI
jgi:hypothetical protein